MGNFLDGSSCRGVVEIDLGFGTYSLEFKMP